MQQTVRLQFRRRPSAWRYMASAFYPSPEFDRHRPFPDISARWIGHRADKADCEDLLRLCGAKGSARGYAPLLYPHIVGFRLQMVILTHPVFPLPIWRTLQVRNHLLQHRPVESDAALDFATRIAGHRVLEKGLEVDLYTTVDAHGVLTWESLNTFYYRGRLRPPEAPSPLAQAPPVGAETVARWHMAAGESRRFGALTGDYNGIHLADGYARWLGFKRAFFHPQRVIGQCLTHLEAPDETKAQRLDVWLKGPVYHDSEVHLRAGKDDAGTVFALFAGAEQRPSILGRVRNVPADVRLLAVESAKTA